MAEGQIRHRMMNVVPVFMCGPNLAVLQVHYSDSMHTAYRHRKLANGDIIPALSVCAR